ncbi:hypothetical protein Ciccas_012215 [Cichlidogyrus casuarinus]|uniref:Uncharacterized protein n=1 Tax=Cichlidogyrus casuarinus TaxID=1844966 RepID=A0ABD2PQA8_9PLAT
MKALEMTTKERIEKVLADGSVLMDAEEGHYAADRIKCKCEAMESKFQGLWQSSMEFQDHLNSQMLVCESMQTMNDLDEWFQEKSQTLQDMVDDYRDNLGRQISISKRYAQHRAFQAELEASEESIRKTFEVTVIR